MGIVLSAIVGIAAADLAPLPLAGLLFTIAAAAFAWWQRGHAAFYALIGCCFFTLHSWKQSSSRGVRLAREIGSVPQAITARGTVISDPAASSAGSGAFLFRLKSITRGENTWPTKAVVLARWRGDAQFGDRLQLFGVIEPTAGPRNPGEFDYRAYLRRRDIFHALTVHYPENGKLLARGGGNPFLRAAARSRHWMQAALSRGLESSPEASGVINGIVLGLREETPDEIMEQFQQTGTFHLFAVAGLHVGIVAFLLWSIASAAGLPRRGAAALVIPALFFYAAITGLNTSSLRAALMAAFVLGGLFADRRVQSANSLAAAAVAILCVDTNQLFSIGFQLSFAVVACIVLFTQPLFSRLVGWCEPDPFLPRSLLGPVHRFGLQVWRKIAGGASVSLAAWAGSLPLILPYFYLVTPVSLFANLVVVPMAFGVLAVGLLSLISTVLLPPLALVFNNANFTIASAILGAVGLFSRAPASHYYMQLPHRPSGARAEMTVLDVGAGAAIHLRSGWRDWLCDTGPERDFNRILRGFLRFRGVNNLDGLVLTHGDAQHIGAAISVQRAFHPRVICDNAAPDRSSVHQALIAYLETHRIERNLLAAYDLLPIGGKIGARVLFPPSSFVAKSADDQALVVQLAIEGTRVLLMSDSGTATERLLLASGADLRSDIILKGQHYSGASGTAEFLDAVQPRLIVTSSLAAPESERVKEDWTAEVAARGIRLYRQDETGAVTLRFFRNGRWQAKPYLRDETFSPPARQGPTKGYVDYIGAP